jgi:hypothetical protein
VMSAAIKQSHAADREAALDFSEVVCRIGACLRQHHVLSAFGNIG